MCVPDQEPPESRLDRSGLAALDVLACPTWRPLFEACQRAQEEFLSHEGRIFEPAYRWPHRPLQTWNRILEYPYVLHHLEAWRRERAASGPARLLDFGSGTTFFPFLLARRGLEVTATDPDPVVERTFRRALEVEPHEAGTVGFARIAAGHVPAEDASFGAVYSVSVLEHVDDLAGVVDEVARLLAPEGRLVFTCDVALDANAELSPDAFERLFRLLEDRFTWVLPPRLEHPMRLLTFANSPESPARRTGRVRVFIEALKKDVKRLLGVAFPADHDSALFLGVMRRRAERRVRAAPADLSACP